MNIKKASDWTSCDKCKCNEGEEETCTPVYLIDCNNGNNLGWLCVSCMKELLGTVSLFLEEVKK